VVLKPYYTGMAVNIDFLIRHNERPITLMNTVNNLHAATCFSGATSQYRTPPQMIYYSIDSGSPHSLHNYLAYNTCDLVQNAGFCHFPAFSSHYRCC